MARYNANFSDPIYNTMFPVEIQENQDLDIHRIYDSMLAYSFRFVRLFVLPASHCELQLLLGRWSGRFHILIE